MKYKVIVTGATGMVGEGVMKECLRNDDVEEVLIINRRPSGFVHPKLKEVIHVDFHDFSNTGVSFKDYHACFFCLGVSSVGMSKEDYYKYTYDLTMEVAKNMSMANPNIIFCYVSGSGTDSTGNGLINWARVKGKTENALLKLTFKKAYMLRPGFIEPEEGNKNTHKFYKYAFWLMPFIKTFFSKQALSLKEIGRAMINLLKIEYPKSILEISDIKKVASL